MRWCYVIGLIYMGLFSVSSVAFDAPLKVTGVQTIDIFQARQLYNQGAVFIDVRNKEEWSIGHIAGAVHLDFQKDFGRLYTAENIQKDTPIVIYCNGVTCLRSAYACAVSVYWGFSNVYYFRNGYFEWMLYDFPVTMKLSANSGRQ